MTYSEAFDVPLIRYTLYNIILIVQYVDAMYVTIVEHCCRPGPTVPLALQRTHIRKVAKSMTNATPRTVMFRSQSLACTHWLCSAANLVQS